jgi:hypothetical protein
MCGLLTVQLVFYLIEIGLGKENGSVNAVRPASAFVAASHAATTELRTIADATRRICVGVPPDTGRNEDLLLPWVRGLGKTEGA